MVPESVTTTVIHSLEDVSPLPPLRLEDLKECAALGLTAGSAIDLSIRGSTQAYAVRREGQLMCVWGYRRTGKSADIWLLTTEEVNVHPFTFIRESKRLLSVLVSNLTSLRCEVATDYTRTRQWLARMGFENVGPSAHNPHFLTYVLGGNIGST